MFKIFHFLYTFDVEYFERTFQSNNILDGENLIQEEGSIRIITPTDIATEFKENINSEKRF